MKKKKEPRKEQMPDVEFKQFTAEEDRIYTEAVTRFREAVAAGKSLKQAFESHAVADKDLEKIIQADFLKIMIAERHFGAKQPLEQVAKDLGVQESLVKDTYGRMLQEVGISSAAQFRKEHGALDPNAPRTDD